MNCSSCSHENPPGAKFCLECGSPVARRCPACSTDALPTAKFCPECGAALQGAVVRVQVSDLEPRSTAAEAPDIRPDAERRQLTVMFCEIERDQAVSRV